MLAAAQAAAAAGNAKLTVFDGNLDPATQVKQLQDAVASGKYDGIILQPVYGAGLVEDAKAGHRRGHRGRQHRPDPRRRQHDRRPPGRRPAVERRVRPERARPQDRRAGRHGLRRHRTRATSATSGRSRPPRSTTTLKKAFDKATRVNPNIKVVAEGESFYTTAAGLKAAQDMLTAHPDDQRDHGRRPGHHRRASRRSRTRLKDKVKLVGYGGGDVAFQGIKAGERFGTVMQAPATEGGLGTEQFIQAIRTGTPAAGRRRPRQPARRRRRDQGQRRHVPAARGVAGLTIGDGSAPWPPRATSTSRSARSASRSAATRALDDVSVAIRAGSVHAFVGENGAGKSTLGKIVAGVFPPDQGELLAARRAGRVPVAARGAGARHRARRPGGRARPPADRGRERVPRRRAATRSASSTAARCASGSSAWSPTPASTSRRTRSSGRCRSPSSSRSRSCGRSPATPSSSSSTSRRRRSRRPRSSGSTRSSAACAARRAHGHPRLPLPGRGPRARRHRHRPARRRGRADERGRRRDRGHARRRRCSAGRSAGPTRRSSSPAAGRAGRRSTVARPHRRRASTAPRSRSGRARSSALAGPRRRRPLGAGAGDLRRDARDRAAR